MLIEFGNGCFELQRSPGGLKLLDEIRRPGAPDASAALHEGQTQCCPEMGFASARWPEEQQIGALSSQLSPAAKAMI